MPVCPGTRRSRPAGECSTVFGNGIDFRELHILIKHRMRGRQITKLAGEINVLAMIEMLITEEDNLPA